MPSSATANSGAEYRRKIRRVTWPLLGLALTTSLIGYQRTDFVTYLLIMFGGAAFVLFLAWRDILPTYIEHWGRARMASGRPRASWRVCPPAGVSGMT